MRIVVLDRASMGDDLDFSVLKRFGEVVIYEATAADEVKDRVKCADTVIVNKNKLNAANLEGSSVRLICEFATGYDNIDIGYCRDAGIAVSNVVNYSTDSVTLCTVATVLSLAMKLSVYERSVSDGRYASGKNTNIIFPAYHELRGKVWGIVGYGNIGKSVGRVAQALGCETVAYKRTPTDEVRVVDIDTLCRISDIITIHTPLNDGTRSLIDERRVALMKPDVILVNEARGAVWDEEAVSRAVEEGRIGALGCDVYTAEPIAKDNPLMRIADRDNVILTPHTAWGAYEARMRCLDECVKNIEAFLKGEQRNRVEVKP